MSYSPKGDRQPPKAKSGCALKKLLMLVAFLAFVLGGVFFGFVFLVNATDVVRNLLGDRVPLNVGSKNEDAPDWESKERVNILLLGIDRRADQKDEPTRTDTMIIATIDPYGKTAGMIAIPRDLWVPIPLDQGRVVEDRINTAHFYGDMYKLPGGGPALAKKTVQYNFGIKIHYYARVDFDAFERVVDTLGGVTMDIDRPLVDDAYPTENYGVMRIYIPAGLQRLDGRTALQYARSRHQDSDLGRNRRQQLVLMAIREKAMQLDIISKLPTLINEFNDSTIKTDMNPSEILTLAKIGKEVDPSSIVNRSLDDKQLTRVITQSGADVLVPKRAELAKIVNEVFFDPKLREENATIEVLNASGVSGQSQKAAGFLQDKGYTGVTYASTLEKSTSKDTKIISYTGKKYTVQLLAKLLNIPSDRIENKSPSGTKVDIQLVLGQSFRLPDK